ncbi:MAG: GAF domain-containing protein, partial [Nitrospirae bacterium]
MSRRLQGGSGLDERLAAVLGILRRMAGADRCAYYRTEAAEEGAVARLRLLDPPGGEGAGTVFRIGATLGCTARLAAGEAIRSDVASLPAGVRDHFEALGAAWILAVPITVGGEWEGVLCFSTADARGWSHEEELVFTTAATEIGAAIARHRSERALAESEQRYRDLFEN